MKDDSTRRQMMEEAWRRELSAAERQRDPALAEEAALTSLLRDLPEAPASSNFTSRVLRAVELEEAAAARKSRPWSLLSRWLPRLAAGCAVLVATLIWHGKTEAQRRAEIVRSVAIISAPSLTPEILADFDAIQVMSRTPAADEQLLALME